MPASNDAVQVTRWEGEPVSLVDSRAHFFELALFVQLLRSLEELLCRLRLQRRLGNLLDDDTAGA